MLGLEVDKDASTPLYVQASEALTRAVAEGRLRPGERLPGEVELARRLRVNRLTVSRAYDVLRERKLIVQRRGSGTFVTEDAREKLEAENGGRLLRVGYVLGERDLSVIPSPNQFIVTNALQGLRDGLGDGADIRLLAGYGPEELDPLDQFDALVMQKLEPLGRDLIADLYRSGIPVVQLMMRPPFPGLPSVNYDRDAASRLACEHLCACGYRRIGFMGAVPPLGAFGRSKLVAFLYVLQDHGLDILARDILPVSVEAGEAYSAALKLIRRGDLPDAIFVDTDYKAMEVLRAFHDHGIVVPRDVGLTGYDGLPESERTDPPLTTVSIPRREIGRRAGEVLVRWIETGEPPETALVQPELVVRETTRPASASASTTERRSSWIV